MFGMNAIKKCIKSIMYLYYFIINLPSFLINGVKWGYGIKLRGRLFLKRRNGGQIFIGNNVCINSSLGSNSICNSSKTILSVNNGRIIISDFVGISNSAIVSDLEIFIGEYSNLGSGTCIYDTDFHSLNHEVRLNGDSNIQRKPVHIGKYVFIGGNCLILKGVTIGDGAVIGAGSVVTKSVPSGEIWAGNPAKFIRKVPSSPKKNQS